MGTEGSFVTCETKLSNSEQSMSSTILRLRPESEREPIMTQNRRMFLPDKSIVTRSA